MNKLSMTNCSVAELSHNDLISIDGGGLVDSFINAVKGVGRAVGYGVGYAGGAIYDVVCAHGADVAESGGAAATLAYK